MSGGPKQTLESGCNKFVVRNTHGCWGWSGCAPKNPGYGQFRSNMKKERHSYLGKKGENNHKCKISKDIALEVKKAVSYENSLQKVAEMFNISKSIVGHIKYGNTWKEVVI